MSQVAHQAGAYPGFPRMKRLGVFLLSPAGVSLSFCAGGQWGFTARHF